MRTVLRDNKFRSDRCNYQNVRPVPYPLDKQLSLNIYLFCERKIVI